MSRVQLALRVADLEGSVAFYSKLFGAEPAKRRPGYANFAIAEPPPRPRQPGKRSNPLGQPAAEPTGASFRRQPGHRAAADGAVRSVRGRFGLEKLRAAGAEAPVGAVGLDEADEDVLGIDSGIRGG